SRSARPPPRTATSEAAAKKAATATPNCRSPKPRSWRSGTDCVARRKTGKVPTVVSRLAPSTVRTEGDARTAALTRGSPRRALDAASRGRACLQPPLADRPAALLAGAVDALLEALERGVDVGQARPTLPEQGVELRTLEGDRRALRV